MGHGTHGSRKRRFAVASVVSLALAFAAVGCADESGSGTCSWLFAPSSFVDAGQPGCSAEPAGSLCDPATERCPTVCGAGEYLLTCLKSDVSTFAIPEEELQDPVVIAERGIKCTAYAGDGAASATRYCCQFKR